jgi:hypothetical protein
MEGSGLSMQTPMERADLSKVSSEYTRSRQENLPKIDQSQKALLFLQNPAFADTPLEEMKTPLLQILGHSLFNELGIREATDKDELIQTLQNNVGIYKKQLDQAKKDFEKKAKAAVQRSRVRYAEQDKARILTLHKSSAIGFGKIGLDWIAQEVQAGLLAMKI